MNINLDLDGDDAPVVSHVGASLSLRYADPVSYSRRCSADDATVRALASHVVTSASAEQQVPYFGGLLANGPMITTYVLAPRAAPQDHPSTSPKPRR